MCDRIPEIRIRERREMEGKNRRNVLQDTGFFISYALFNWENGDTDYDGGMKKEKVTNTFERESLTVM